MLLRCLRQAGAGRSSGARIRTGRGPARFIGHRGSLEERGPAGRVRLLAPRRPISYQHLIHCPPDSAPCRGSSAGQSASFSTKGDTHNLEVVGSKPTPGTTHAPCRTGARPARPGAAGRLPHPSSAPRPSSSRTLRRAPTGTCAVAMRCTALTTRRRPRRSTP